MKKNFTLMFVFALLLYITTSPHSYAQTKEELFRDALRNAVIETDFSSTATIDRGDINKEEIISWFQRNAPLSSKSKQVIVSYKVPKWKWGKERYTKTTISYLTRQNESAFTEYYVEIARREAEAIRKEKINTWLTIAGGTAVAIAFFSSDFGKQTLLAALSAFGGGNSPESTISGNKTIKEKKEEEKPKEEEKQFDPNNCEIPSIIERGNWEKPRGMLPTHDMECSVKFKDDTYATITMYKLDDRRVYYSYKEFLLIVEDRYDTFEHAAEAAWVFKKHRETRKVGKI